MASGLFDFWTFRLLGSLAEPIRLRAATGRRWTGAAQVSSGAGDTDVSAGGGRCRGETVKCLNEKELVLWNVHPTPTAPRQPGGGAVFGLALRRQVVLTFAFNLVEGSRR